MIYGEQNLVILNYIMFSGILVKIQLVVLFEKNYLHFQYNDKVAGNCINNVNILNQNNERNHKIY